MKLSDLPEINSTKEFLNHKFVCFWRIYFECSRCKLVVKLSRVNPDEFFILDAFEQQYAAKLELTCEEVIIKNIIE